MENLEHANAYSEVNEILKNISKEDYEKILKSKIEDMEKLGYSKEEVIKITKSLPPIYSYSTDTLKQKIEEYIQQKKTQDLGKETLEIQKETSYIQQTEHAMNNQEQMLEQKNQADINID